MKHLLIAGTILCIWVCAFSQSDTSNQTVQINDGDKTSSKDDDMYGDIQTAQKAVQDITTAVSAVQGGQQLYDRYGNAANFSQLTQKLKVDVMNSATSLIVQYKNTKAPVIQWVENVINKTQEVMSKINAKLTEWRTTVPTLEGYGNAAVKAFDNTVAVAQEFKISDMFDIDRKWDRDLEGQMSLDYNTFMGFSQWLKERYYLVNQGQMQQNMLDRYTAVLDNDDLAQIFSQSGDQTEAYYEVVSTMSIFRKQPKIAIVAAAEAITDTRQILSKSQEPASNGQETKEAAMMDSIQNAITDQQRTMKDEAQLQAYIELKRHEVGLQRIELNRIMTNLQIKYARIIQWKKEKTMMEENSYANVMSSIAMQSQRADLTRLGLENP